MSVKKFKFVSPGVFVNEIDNSQLPAAPDRLGPVIVGRTERGPAMRPVTVTSQAEFVEMFGNAIPGGLPGDVWREGNYQSPTYASYAAMAYLRNNGPLTMVRLLGQEHADRTTDSGEAGWKANKAAYGMLLWDSGSTDYATLAAIWYFDAGVVALSGASHASNGGDYESADALTNSAGIGIQSVGSTPEFKATIYEDATATTKTLETVFNFNKNSDKFIRKVFNTNPSLLEASTISTSAQRNYFLGQTFEDHIKDYVDMGTKSALAATLVDAIDCSDIGNLNLLTNAMTITVPVAAGGADPLDGITIEFINGNVNGSGGSSDFNIGTSGETETGVAALILKVINGQTDGRINEGGVAPGIAGITAKLGSEAKKLTITADNDGVAANGTTITMPDGGTSNILKGLATSVSLAGGKGSHGHTVGMIVKLADGSDKDGGNFKRAAESATTGWVLSQQIGNDTGSFNPKADPPTGCNKLFRLNALDCGEWEASNLKVSIEDIRYSHSPLENPYGSFTVTLRKRDDNDAAPKFVERFANCNLNPQSQNYVKRKIGDQTLQWVEGERRYKVVGDYPNNSQFVTCEVNPDLDKATLDTQLLPFGFVGPKRFRDITIAVASRTFAQLAADPMISPTDLLWGGDGSGGEATTFHFGDAVGTIRFPEVRLRLSSSQGALSNRTEAYFGIDTLESGSSKSTNRGWSDLMYPFPDQAGGGYVEAQWAFSLDDVELRNGASSWKEGNRNSTDGNPVAYSISGSAGSAGGWGASYTSSLDQGIDRFTMPLWGGYDGLDIKTLDPFAPDIQMGSEPTDKTNYEYYTIKKAIDICADPEVVECNLMAVPGITNSGINQHLINVVENRADSLAILDIKGGYLPRANRLSSYNSFDEYGGSVNSTLTNLTDQGINSSYACCYYPWVQIRDTAMDAVIWVPPSVAALGTMGSSEAKSEVWFSPAGYTRGSLTNGSAGMPTVGVRDRLTLEQRDELYQQNVNPIATFPTEGIVIFGQKTMQVTASALDRINVRRLMIFIKKEISRMAATLLFDQNVQSTWNRFLGRVNPFLRSIQTRLGLTDFKVILDETTTTPELMDRNIMYAKILLKPARAIEFIAIDFVITNSGASFED